MYNQVYASLAGMKEDVVVAIVDTGIDSQHFDLIENMWVNSGEIPGNGRDDDQNGYIDDVNGYNFADNKGDQSPTRDSHGTHVAGLVGAIYGNRIGGTGVLGRHVRLMGLNVFGRGYGAQNNDIENAIRYAAEKGADVINLSLGGCGYTPTMGQAISYALNRGAVVVAAAGNDDRKLSSNPEDGNNCRIKNQGAFSSPASFAGHYPGMMTVGSVDTQEASAKSTFSNFGTSVLRIVAPGAEDSIEGRGLFSTGIENTYLRLQGTSMAAPIVSGAAAIAIGVLKARGHTYTPEDIEELLVGSARSFESLIDVVEGGKTLDVENLLELIDQKYQVR